MGNPRSYLDLLGGQQASGKASGYSPAKVNIVSIQLVFPASGKAEVVGEGFGINQVSIQLVFPASGKAFF